MRKKDVRNSIIEMCPIRNVVARFGNKWALLVVLVLNENGNVRFNALSRMIPDISPRVLSGTLKTLEADGLVRRTVHPEVPPKVEYSLTELGRSLLPILIAMRDWGAEYLRSKDVECNCFMMDSNPNT